jgi:hypothetical protein
MSLVLQSSGGGQITIQEPTTASNFTQTLPAATGTVALLQTPSFATTIGVGGATPAASGAGITFPATFSASTDANTLDDYEEGTWTPALTFSSGGSVTYGTQAGQYTKVGNFVICTFWIQIGSVSSPSGNVTIENLPFTSASGSQRASPALRFQNMPAATGVGGGWIPASSTSLILSLFNNGLAPQLQGSVLQGGSEIGGSIIYTS